MERCVVVAVNIQSAAALPIDALVTIFNSGYSGYIVPVNISQDQFRGHLRHNDIDLKASQIAFINDEPVGICLLGIRGNAGWIGGLGVHPDHRRQSIGRQLMQAAIKSARTKNLDSIHLEVIFGNEGAHQLYRELSFIDTRRLLILERQPTPVSTIDDSFETVTVEDVVHLQSEFHLEPVAWQQSSESLLHNASGTTAWSLSPDDDSPKAYAIGHASNNAISWLDMGCAPGHEVTLATLVSAIHQRYPTAAARIVNISENEPAVRVLRNLGYQETLSQNEMRLDLSTN